VQWLTKKNEFPSVENASQDGLLALGGDLSIERLLLAYNNGIFPWFNDDALIMWWSPNERLVLFPHKIKISKSMRKVLASNQFKLTKNTCFEKVMQLCAGVKRKEQEGTWITPKMKDAYLALHREGHANSYEVWQNDELVGGLYGIDLGHVFCGESMFSSVSNASKFALVKLAQELEQKKYVMIDCQVPTDHLKSMGAEEISRDRFIKLL
jgi:leucyl/phenylalanyl-tRNA--protein transferase